MSDAAYLIALTAHARHVPSASREAFADRARAAVASRGGVLVRTCHRVEVYLPAAGERRTDDGDVPAPPPGAKTLTDDAAARHLLAVATGADSVVVAEDQVLGQLRESLAEAHRAAPLDPVIERLFQKSLAAGRQARAWRQIPPRSLADVALDRIEDAAGSLAGRVLLIVGAGTMGRLAAFAARDRGARVLIANRTKANATALARRVGGLAVGFHAPIDPQTVGLIVAIGGRWRLPALPPVVPIFVDLASPPAVAPEEATRLGERLITADDLAMGPGSEPDRRLRQRLEAVIDEGTAAFVRWVHTRTSVPTIRALRESAETGRADEVTDLLRRMPELDANERALVERMSRRLVARILHEPLRQLREDEDGERARVARALFGL